MANETYLLAKVTEGEDGWEEKFKRVEEKVAKALQKAGEADSPPWREVGPRYTQMGGSPREYLWATSNQRVRDEFVALGAEPETE